MSDEPKPRRTLRRAMLIVVPTVAAIAAGSVIAVAAIPGSDGTIAGCYSTLTGGVRVVDATSQCNGLEKPLTWNQRGQTGATGPAGPAGQTGPAGPAGPAGSGGASASPIIGGQALAGGLADAYLELRASNGVIKGESTNGRFRDAIDVNAFTFGATQSGTSAGSTGRASFQQFHISKLYDQSSPLLLRTLARGEHLVSAKISFVSRGADPQTFLTYEFRDLIVSSYDQGGTSKPPLLEDVSFDFDRVEINYFPREADGSLGAAVTTSWDISRNAEG